MKTDSGHNLSLERISKLHALNFEQFCTRLASSSSSANLAAANAVPAPPAPEAAAIADALSSVGVGNYGMGNRIDVDPDKSVTNAQKWQEKFESLKRYKELYGELSAIMSQLAHKCGLAFISHSHTLLLSTSFLQYQCFTTERRSPLPMVRNAKSAMQVDPGY